MSQYPRVLQSPLQVCFHGGDAHRGKPLGNEDEGEDELTSPVRAIPGKNAAMLPLEDPFLTREVNIEIQCMQRFRLLPSGRAVAAGMKVSMSVNFPVQMPHPNIDASLRQQLASPVVHLCGVQRAPEVGTLMSGGLS